MVSASLSALVHSFIKGVIRRKYFYCLVLSGESELTRTGEMIDRVIKLHSQILKAIKYEGNGKI